MSPTTQADLPRTTGISSSRRCQRCSVLFFIPLLLAIGLFLGLRLPQLGAPQFENIPPPASAMLSSYDFLSPRPFEGGRVCISVVDGSNNPASFGWFIYDLDHRRVLGRVKNGSPVLLFGEPLQLLCSVPVNSLKQRLGEWLARLSQGRVNLWAAAAGQTYWLLDSGPGTARRLGYLPGIPNFNCTPSPDSHFAFTLRSGPSSTRDVFLLDLQQAFIEKLQTPAWPCGWWDSTRILCQSTQRDFLLFDVVTKQTTPLVALAKLAAFLEQNGIADDPKQAGVFSIWNGQADDFYLTDTSRKWSAQESFLIKLEHPDGSLKLAAPRFKFEWSDHLDASGTHYLYSGREPGEASDGVFLRDLSRGTNRILVPPTTNRYFSLPRFYQNSAIYVRSNALWQIGLDGSPSVRLFPPSEAQPENGKSEPRPAP